MTKSIWLVVLFVGLACADEIVAKQSDSKPSSEINNKLSIPIIKLEKNVEPPMIAIDPPEKSEIEIPDEAKIPKHIESFPIIIKNLIGKFFESNSEQQQPQTPNLIPDENNSNDKKISLFIFNSNNEQGTDNNLPISEQSKLEDSSDSDSQPIIRTHFFMFRIFPSFFNSDSEKTNTKLLGGKDDPDNSMFDHMMNGGNMMDHNNIGSINNNDDERPSFFSYFSFSNQPNDEDSIIKTQDGSQIPLGNLGQPKKKCMMFSFMRMKASVYYRTIIHLLFIGSIVLLILLMTFVCLRTYKRRRFYSQNISIATIDDGLPEKKDPTGRSLFLFRFRNSEKQSERDLFRTPSLLITAPPAYDQVVEKKNFSDTSSAVKMTTKSSLVNSLAAAYKNKYKPLEKSENEDNISVASLPTYEDAKTIKI